jgi:RNA polymerase sigma factor (sigma-70 family)
MKIKYKFADGTVSEVEVSDEIGTIIIDSRHSEMAGNRRERYYREFSVDGTDFENDEWAVTATPEDDYLQQYDNSILRAALSQLTPIQRKRLQCYADGMTYREIAELEGVAVKAVQDSIEQARKKVKKFF